MTYINNQYIRLDKLLEEIAKIEIKTDENNNKLIEDLEIEDYSNVVIAYGEKVEYNNIFPSIKILITDETALIKNEYKIPEYIEKIIVYGYVYENKKEEIERIKEGLKNGLELIKVIFSPDILKREEINLNQVNNDGNTALILACFEKKELDVLKLIEKEEIKINQVNKNGNTALIMACYNKMERVALKLLEREEININQVNCIGATALICACENEMESVALKLLGRKDININQVDNDSYTALIMACGRKMERVALKLLDKEDININHTHCYGITALDIAIKNNMENVIKKIKELQKKLFL